MNRIVLYDASAIDRPTREDLQRLARARLAARRDGCDLVLTGVGRRLRLLLELTGLDAVFTIEPELRPRAPDGPEGPPGRDSSDEPEP